MAKLPAHTVLASSIAETEGQYRKVYATLKHSGLISWNEEDSAIRELTRQILEAIRPGLRSNLDQ